MSALYFRSDPSFHISGSRLVGPDRAEEFFLFVCFCFCFFYLLLSQLKAVEIGIMSGFGFHIVDNSLSF